MKCNNLIRSYFFGGIWALGAATVALGQTPSGELLVQCPVMQKEMPLRNMEDAIFRDILGVRYFLCCGPCLEDFEKNPSPWTKPQPGLKAIQGISLFDPVLGARLDLPRAAARVARDGVIYPFLSKESRDRFLKDPKRFTARPAKERLTCPITGRVFQDSAEAAGYSDFEGQRLYFATWLGKSQFDANSAAYKERLSEKKPPSESPGGSVP